MDQKQIDEAYLEVTQRSSLLQQWQRNYPLFKGVEVEAVHGHVSMMLQAWEMIDEWMKGGGEAPSAWKGSGRTFAPMEERTEAATKRRPVK